MVSATAGVVSVNGHENGIDEDGPEWVFGYGSLVWRPAFDFSEHRPGFIRDWRRRFWQGSTDHRGVPGAPGRVVTLVPEPGASCWGMVFRIPVQRRTPILAALDYREKGGYERRVVDVYTPDLDTPVSALMYLATRENPNFLGPATVQGIALQVRAASGPSGPNLEYVLELARALRAMGVVEDEAFELERHLLE